jgi:hypothetical protein
MARFFVLAFIAVALAQHPTNDNHGGDQGQQNAKAAQNNAGPPVSKSGPHPTDKQSTGDANQNKNNEVKVSSLPSEISIKAIKDSIDWTIAICTVILTGVGIIGTCAAVKTLRQIKRQADTLDEHKTKFDELAKAANNNAAAAVNSVKALRETERAWIVEEVRFVDDIPRRDPAGGSGILVAIVIFTNIGRQPAFIKALQTRFHASDKLADSPQFRTIPEVFSEGFTLPPRRKLVTRVMLEEGSFDDEQVDSIQGKFGSPPLSLYIYGTLIYESMGISGVNRFCYRWRHVMGLHLSGDKPGFEKQGPDGYNQHT